MQSRAEMLHRYQELQNNVGSLQVKPAVNVTARQADGRILKAVPGDNMVYINLGARDAMVLGMEFAVYSSETGIPADGRAKARIRVESIYPSSSACKILEVFGRNIILERDLIANPVYDRDRPLMFVVAGDFDLDHDGKIDGNGELGIEAIVSDWGGTVDDKLTALTSFVIIGDAPHVPASFGELPPDLVERNKAIEGRIKRYQNILDTAKTLSVPILSQDVFLHFLGYAGNGSGNGAQTKVNGSPGGSY